MSLGGRAIERDGSIELRGEDRVGFSHVVSQCRLGEDLEVQVLREGRTKNVKVKVRTPASLVPRPQYEGKPTYLLFAGLMFIPLTTEYLKVWEWADVDVRYKHLYQHGVPTAERAQVVLLSHVLAHSANAGYHQVRGAIVERVNRLPIREMKDLVCALRTPVGKHHVIEIDHTADDSSLAYHSASGTHVVLRADDVERATRDVLATYGVSRDRSPDLDGV